MVGRPQLAPGLRIYNLGLGLSKVTPRVQGLERDNLDFRDPKVGLRVYTTLITVLAEFSGLGNQTRIRA